MTGVKRWDNYWDSHVLKYKKLSKGKCEIKARHWFKLEEMVVEKYIKRRDVSVYDLVMIAFKLKRDMGEYCD